MEHDEMWTAIDGQRQAVVDLLTDLSDAEWRRPSLCAGWTVRQVAAHLAQAQNMGWTAMPTALLATARHGGMNGAIHALACRHAERPLQTIIEEIRERIGVWRSVPTVGVHETAIDYLVHGQDIALPLGRSLEMPRDLAAAASDRVWTNPRMFHARRRLAGHRFVADDTAWAVGEGVEVRGPITALLLLLTGRPAALKRLSGPGAASVRNRMSGSAV